MGWCVWREDPQMSNQDFCANRAKHIREQSWSYRARQEFPGWKALLLIRKWGIHRMRFSWGTLDNKHKPNVFSDMGWFPLIRQQWDKSVWCSEGGPFRKNSLTLFDRVMYAIDGIQYGTDVSWSSHNNWKMFSFSLGELSRKHTDILFH